MLKDLLSMAEVLFEDGDNQEGSADPECVESVPADRTCQEIAETIKAGKDIYEVFFS